MDIRYLLSAWRTIKIPGLLPVMRDWLPFMRMHFIYAALANNFQSNGIDASAANLNIVNCSLHKLSPLPNLEDIKTQLAGCGFGRIQVTRFMPRSEFYGISVHVLS